MTVRQLFEIADDRSPSTLSASVEEGKYTRRYVFGPPPAGGTFQALAPIAAGNNPIITGIDILRGAIAGSITPGVSQQDIIDTLNAIVGGTIVAPTGGGLTRLLPMFDPCFTGWPARSVSGFRGVGTPFPATNLPPLDPANTGSFQAAQGVPLIVTAISGSSGLVIPNTLTYPTYEVTVEFAPRPYPMLNDAQVIPRSLESNWIQSDGGARVVLPQIFPEWWRFTTISYEPQNQYVNMKSGQMYFNVVGGASPNRVTLDQVISILLPDDLLTIDWFGIPWRYITSPNSYIRRLRGMINQFTWWETVTGPNDFMFRPGTLLYASYKTTEYSSPLSNLVPWNFQVRALPKLCNVKLVFMHTERNATNSPTPANRNYISAQGWNVQPWLGGQTPNGIGLPGGRQFYYASTTQNDASGNPAWVSAPIPQLLFQDPDAPTAVDLDDALPF